MRANALRESPALVVAMIALVVAMSGTGYAALGDGSRGAVAAGNARGEPVEIQVRNRSRGETGLITSSDDYSLRLSNTKEGGGGGAVYGCRAPDAPPGDNLACLYADNLRGGKAFLFRSREGQTVGHFDIGDATKPPFTTNAGGLVANLNADKVDGLDAADLRGATGPQGPQGPPGPSTGPAGGDLAGSYPNPTLRSGAVGSAAVADGSLTVADTFADVGGASSNPGSIAANTCVEFEFAFVDQARVGDLTLIIPSSSLPEGFSLTGLEVVTDGAFRIQLCNTTENPVDPAGFSYHVLILRP